MTDEFKTLLKILLHDEVQLIDWGESRGTGPWVKLRLPNTDNLEIFRGLDTATAKHTGHIFNITLSQGDIIPAQPQEKATDGAQDGRDAVTTYGQEAQQLAKSSFFRTPKVWEAVGSDEQFKAWVRVMLPCIVCGDRDFDPDTGIGRCEFAHVRRAGDSGTAYKAEYSGVSMCNKHHSLQHDHAETAAYREHLKIKNGREQMVSEDQTKDWFNKMRIQTVFNWCWETVKKELGYDSWANVPPPKLLEWAEKKGVTMRGDSLAMPRCYYDTYHWSQTEG